MKYNYYIFFIVLLFANVSVAQQQLSLNEAISLGLERHYDIRIEGRNVEIAKLNNNWGALFPSLTGTIQGSRTTFDNREALSPFAILAKTNTSQIQPGVNVNWNLLSIANITIGKRQLEQMQAESQGNADIVVANSIQAIILGYYGAVLQKRRLDEFQKQLSLSRDKYELLVIKAEMGSAVTSDLLLEEGNFLTDSANYINQLLTYNNAASNLNFLIGEPNPDREYLLTDDLVFEYEELTFQDLSNLVETQNLDLQKQYLTQSILGSTTKLRKLDRYPTLTLGGNYTWTRNRQDISDWPLDFRTGEDGSITNAGNNENFNYGLNFTISFNLFDGGRVNRAIKEALIREDIGNIQTDKLKASLYRDLVQALDQYRIRKQLYDINDRRFQASEQNLNISEEKFKNGTINSFDYRTVQNNNLSAATVRLQSIFDLIDSQVTLMRLTGGLMQEYGQ
ncbi:MAG: TolC family protein [Cyclobacteriaceae bacterium]|nr:TolC family protein [Cyclobacteriaceae bacterium HetDA_MAG_MS6]